MGPSASRASRDGHPGRRGRGGSSATRRWAPWSTWAAPSARSVPTLLTVVEAGQLDAGHLITHRFALDDVTQAYGVFADPVRGGALKAVLTRT